MKDVWSHPFLQGLQPSQLEIQHPPFIPPLNGTNDVIVSQNLAEDESDDFLDCSNSTLHDEDDGMDEAFKENGESCSPAFV